MSLTRPIPGDPLSLSAGKSSTAIVDAIADVVEANEAKLTARTSPDIVTTDPYPDVAQVVLHTADSLSDSLGVWTGAGLKSGSVTLDTGVKTTGTASVTADLAFPSGSGTANKLYVDLTTPLAVGGHPRVSVDIRWVVGSGSGSQTAFEVVVASGAGLTGTTATLALSNTNIAASATWYTLDVPLSGTGLTTIASVGVRKRSTASGGSSSKHVFWWLDNIVAGVATGLDSALVAEPTAAIVIPPTYTSVFAQASHDLGDQQSIVDLRPSLANITRMRGVRHARDFNIDETGATDVTDDIARVLNDLGPGDTLEFSPTGIYWIENGINLSDNIGVTLECNGARFVEHAHRQGSVINHSGSFNTIRNMHVIGLGTPSTLTNGSALIPVTGTPSVVGSTMSLGSLNDVVRIQGQGSSPTAVAQTYSRDIDGYIQFDLVLSQASPIAADCRVQVIDSYNNPSSFPQNVSYIADLTLTSTPTTYQIRFQPVDLYPGHMLTITKMHAGSPIVVTSFTAHHLMQNLVYQSDNGSNHGLNLVGDHNIADNIFVEGMGGDGIQIGGPSLNNTQPNWPQDNRCRNFYSRGTGRHGITLTHGTDNVLENFIIYNTGRDGMDIEPEGDQSHISHMTFRNGVLSGGENGGNMISSAPARQDHITFDNVWFKTNGGSPLLFDLGTNSIIRDCKVTSEDGLGKQTEFQGGTKAKLSGTGSPEGKGMTVERFRTQGKILVEGENVKLRDIHCERLIQDGTLIVSAPGCDINGFLIGDPTADYTIDPAVKFVPVQLADDTTYRNIQCPSWFEEFPNSYKQATAYGNSWWPLGLKMLGQGVRSMRGISATDTPANNLRGIGVSVTTSATTKTIAFPAKTDVLNPTNFTLTASGPEKTNVSIDPGPGDNIGSWSLTYNGQTTTTFPETWNPNSSTGTTTSAATVQAALQALSNIGAGNVTVTGTRVFDAGFTLTWGAAFTTTLDHSDLTTGTSTVQDKNDRTRTVQVKQTSTGGSIAPGTYYYRVAGRTAEGGSLAGLAEKSVVVGSTQNQVTVALSGVGYDQSVDKVISAWRVWRGTVAGGPYDTRYDVISPTGFGLDTSLIDHGIDFGGDISPQSGSWSAAVINADQSGYEFDATYAVLVTPSWSTTVSVTAKRDDGFDLAFGTAAPSGAKIDWFVVR